MCRTQAEFDYLSRGLAGPWTEASAPGAQSRHSALHLYWNTEQPPGEGHPQWVGAPLAGKLAQPAQGSGISFQNHSTSSLVENTCS